jgi:hypothetical protein
MKRVLFATLLILICLPLFHVNAQAIHYIQYTPCIASDGTYQLGVTAVIKDVPFLELRSWINSDPPTLVGFVSDGWNTTYTGLISGWFGVLLEGTNWPACPESKKQGEPLFQMWLLTRPESACILISEFHPSVERQEALCFPGQEWVAENALCSGWVYDDGYWDCDMYGYSHLPFADLFKIFKRHAAMLEELSP